MNTSRQSGFTLLELMTAVALTTVLGGAMFALGDQAQRSAARTSAHSDDLEGYRRAMRVLADDLRAASTVETGPTGETLVESPDGVTTWRSDDGMLTRSQLGRDETMARSVLALVVTPCAPTWNIELRITERTTLRTSIARRVEVSR